MLKAFRDIVALDKHTGKVYEVCTGMIHAFGCRNGRDAEQHAKDLSDLGAGEALPAALLGEPSV